MTRRAAVAVVGAADPVSSVDAPGKSRDLRGLRVAMCEDVYDRLAGLELLDAGLAVPAADERELAALTWPGAPVVVRAGRSGDQEGITDVLAGLGDLGYDQAVLVAADAPDLPGLLVGKLLRALGKADVAVCPAEDGTLVALAVHLPAAAWVGASGVGLDTADALARLRAAAPRRLAVGVGPGWHRVRSVDDLATLDRGLEGWDATRAWLARLR